MLANQNKADLITEISGKQTDRVTVLFLHLLDILITETREANDTAETPSFIRNQGKIQALLDLKLLIKRGLPGSLS